MFFILIIFAIIGVCIAGSKALKGLREENPEKAKTWGFIALGIILLVSGLKVVYRILFPNSDSDDSTESKYSYYILTEDYVFIDIDNNLPKAYFKKGDVVKGMKLKAEKTDTVTTAAQTPVSQVERLYLLSAKISIPLDVLRYPTEAELKEIEGDFKQAFGN